LRIIHTIWKLISVRILRVGQDRGDEDGLGGRGWVRTSLLLPAVALSRVLFRLEVPEIWLLICILSS
jgi:hypothetical protein